MMENREEGKSELQRLFFFGLQGRKGKKRSDSQTVCTHRHVHTNNRAHSRRFTRVWTSGDFYAKWKHDRLKGVRTGSSSALPAGGQATGADVDLAGLETTTKAKKERKKKEGKAPQQGKGGWRSPRKHDHISTEQRGWGGPAAQSQRSNTSVIITPE